MKQELEKLIKRLEQIESMWDGDEAGSFEDMAITAHEALEKIQELKELLKELNIEL